DVIYPLAERLKGDGIRVWLDVWEIRSGHSFTTKIEEGLERSRLLILCTSANTYGSDWAAMESQTFRFRDPLNKERRFIQLRLDDTKPRGSLIQHAYLDWRKEAQDEEYFRLLELCQPSELSSRQFHYDQILEEKI